MQMRQVPRNIDKPNRTPEYAVTFLATYYLILFLTGKALFALVAGALATYIMYKVTLDKPEGLALRLAYRYVKFGKMRPSPKYAPRLEV
jgi:hypothetical protein